MSISQKELDSAYAADADRLNDQRRLALESPPISFPLLRIEDLVELANDFLADDDYEGILELDAEEDDGFSEEAADKAFNDSLHRFWGV